MRIAIVGATGNVGTAVLHELAQRHDVQAIAGIARRLPQQHLEPYRQATWHSVEVQFETSREQLTEIFADYDVVIHLAWLTQPSTKTDLLHKTNVDGTRNVLEAAAQAGIKHLVVASSFAAYSPVQDDAPRDESWPTEGIPTSQASQDKAAQEHVINEFQTRHPGVTVARIRSAIALQAGAGSQIQRYFLGSLVPVQALRFGRPPIMLFPKGARVQVVHTDDLAQAYVLAALYQVDGAFNICADDVLDAPRIGGVVTGNPKYGRVLPVAPGLVRSLVKTAHRGRLIPMDAGWLDIALQAPLLDNGRAKRELGWDPTTSGAAAFEELLQGMIHGQGQRSAPLRARHQPSVEPFVLPDAGHQLPEHVDASALRQYMADHVAGSTAGLNRIQKLADTFHGTLVYGTLATMAEEIRVEQQYLQHLMKRQGFPRAGVAAPALWVGERVARLKTYVPKQLNVTPSVLTLETELMLSAVTGKLHGWKTLLQNAEALGVPEQVFEQLIADSLGQYRALERVHEYARHRAFDTAEETSVKDWFADF